MELYEYDGFNRLMRSNVNGEEASYTYRVDGLRNSKTSATGTTTHLWDGANIVADLNGGTVVARYVRGVNLLFSYSSAGQKFYLYNGHGNVVQLASSTGAILWRYDYDGFGNEREIAGQDPAQDANPFRYCGEYFDKETGSIYLRARYYNPVMGRFYSEDPIRDGLNWYAYGSNNPLFYLDPFGLAIVPIRDFVTKYGGSFQSYDKLRASVFAIGNINLSVLWTGYNTAGINITNNNGYLSADSSDLFTFFENAILPSIEEEYLREDWAFNIGLVIVCLPGGYAVTSGGAALVTAADTLALQKMSESASRVAPAAQRVAEPAVRVIGSYPEYVVRAQNTVNSRFFQIPIDIWSKMSPEEQWAANVKFLDRAIAQGAHFIIESSKSVANYGPGLQEEIKYLLNAGYIFVENGTKLIPGI